MPMHHHAMTVTLLATTLAAQEAKEEKVEPVALVSRAEKLLKSKEVEDAVLLLWQALDLLSTLPANAVHDATALSARFLLAENDPREAQRRATFTSIAKQQVELAAAYRAKKWLDTAATRLVVADRFDRDAGVKERAAIEAARPKANAKEPPAPPPKPAQPQLAPLLQRANTEFVHGDWKESGDVLECQAPVNQHFEWVTSAAHADHEVVVEFRPVDAKVEHNAVLAVGLAIQPGTHNYSGYRLQCAYYPKTNEYGLILFAVRGMAFESLGDAWVPAGTSTDGFRRLSIQVHGPRLRAQLDGGPPIEVATPADVRGKVGVLHGVADRPTCAVQFRNLRIDALPADRPTDDELRAQQEAENQNAITVAVDEAKDLLAKKQPEPASLRLREALGRVRDLPAGVLRDNLHKSIGQMLAQADPLAPRRKKAAQTIASELVTLADEYAKAGLVRAAHVLVEDAAGFDPEGQAARLAAAEQAVRQWNVAQATARASELAPPADDGAGLREWFAKGRKLETYYQGFVVDGAVARAEAMMGKALATWAPHPLAPKLEKFSVYAHLPAPGVHAGVLFDVIDSANFGVVFLEREAKVMRLHAFLKVGGKWVPLLQRDVAMDAWRRDGWHQITVEANATGLLAMCGNAKIQVPRKLMGKATGVPGLYAWSETDAPVSVEFRAFKAGP